MSGITIVSATKEPQQSFSTNTALGRTLSISYPRYDISTRIFYNNKIGLSELYNTVINDPTVDKDEILLFLHDDVFLPDFFWFKRAVSALKIFDLIGVAGNKRRIPNQPAWCFTDVRLEPPERGVVWDDFGNLSGIVGQGDSFPCKLSIFGVQSMRCKLLDGVLLGAKKSVFVDNDIRFDEQFKFHFYDMDICRQFESAGLKIGTADISVIHESPGNFGSPSWQAGYNRYLEKWGQ